MKPILVYYSFGKEPEAVTQLMVKDLLAKDKQGNARNVTAYRVREKDLQAFGPGIEAFLKNIGARALQHSFAEPDIY